MRSHPWLGATATAVVLSLALVAGYSYLRHDPVAGSAAFRTPPSASPTTDPEPEPIATPSMAGQVLADPAVPLRAAIDSYVTGRGAHLGVVVLDRVTGETLAYNDSVRFATASVVKVDILATLLLRAQRAGRPLTAAQKDLASQMITESDNDAATELWDEAGGATGVAQANRTFGLTQTSPNRDDYWGLTTTTPADQVRLLGVLADPAGPLSAASRGYALDLMSRVESDQRWGVPAAAGTATTAVYVKDGWLSNGNDDDRWIVNSVGRLVEPGHDWLVAVLSDHTDDEDAAIATVEHVASTVVTGLREALDG